MRTSETTATGYLRWDTFVAEDATAVSPSPPGPDGLRISTNDQVLAVIREREVGRASGAPVETTHLAVFTLTGGKIVQMQVFDDRQQALEPAGLACPLPEM